VSVTAVVVNFNAGEALQACVRSLLNSSLRPFVAVLDNASTDRSAEHLRSLYADFPGLEIRFNPGNIGFAPAVNLGVRAADTDYVLVINPDCEVERDTIARLCRALETDPQAAVAGPRVTDARGRIEKASQRRFPDPWKSLVTYAGLWRLGRWIPAFRGVPVAQAGWSWETVRAEAVSGACMLLRRSAFVEAGGMDEGYAMHCEDLDLMYRLHRAGWHCLYVPGAGARHTQGVPSRSRPLWVHRQKHLGMARFYRKFQAHRYPFLFNWLVYAGIFLHFLLLAPVRWLAR
jgi:GT2 family glycosyltransferase